MTNLSGTYNFDPPIGTLALSAFSRCQVKRTEIGAQHMEDAFLETNLLQSRWSAKGITFWTVQLVQQPLTQGIQNYTVPVNAVTVLDVYINNGTSNRLITSFSRTDFASLAEPQQQGFPTSYWFNRSLPPQSLNLWPVPDAAATYTMNYYIYTLIQDGVVRQGGNAAVPAYWLDAYVAELAYRMSRCYAPQLEDKRKQDAKEAYDDAASQAEQVPLYITPGLQGYYRP
jgi:hypothetical protein